MRIDPDEPTRDRSAAAAQPCPCGEGLPYDVHCGRLHDGDPAVTAEALMRSRYAAHVMLDADHLARTWQSATRPADVTPDPGVRWLGLEIHRTERGLALDGDGIVEFTARYERNGRRVDMREISRFARESGRWVYVDGIRP